MKFQYLKLLKTKRKPIALFFFIFTVTLCLRYFLISHPTVKTIYGLIEGFDYESADVFLGIPYAKPPTGDLRLDKPQPPEPWVETFKAKKFSKDCMLFPEECLALNIVKPQTPSANPSGYPVLIFLHGGAFLAGSSRQVGYKNIAKRIVPKGFVVVTINYRLGFFGFFSTGTPEAPGNVGIWDQIQALKFVQNVISDFNGDPNQVTIWGESAGAVSASYLTITPHADNLFQRAIFMSGSALANWADGNKTVETSWAVLKHLGCDESPDPKVCALEHSTQEILDALTAVAPTFIAPDNTNIVQMHPVFNKDLFPNSKSWEDAIKKAKNRPQFMGVTSQEDGSFVLRFNSESEGGGTYHPMPLSVAKEFTENEFQTYIKAILNTERFALTQDYVNSVIHFYKNQMSNYNHNQTFQAYVQFFSDFEFNIPAIREARMKAAAGNAVYFYLLSIAPVNNVPLIEGSPHSSQSSMFFDSYVFTFDSEKAEADMLESLLSFAKNGIPTTAAGMTFEKVTAQKVPYISFDKNSTLHSDLWPDRLDFYAFLSELHDFDLPSGKMRLHKTSV